VKRNRELSALRLSFSLLSSRQKKKYMFALFIQSSLAFLDLIGVALISLIGSLAIRGVQSLTPGDRVTYILEMIGLQSRSLQFQVAALGFLAVIFLSGKTILSYLFTRKLLHFLAAISSEISSNLISKTLSGGHLALQNKSKAEIQYSTGDGVTAITVGILGLAASLTADLFLLLLLIAGISIVDPYTAITTFLFFGAVGTIMYFSLHKRARQLSKRVVELNIKGSETIFEVIGAFREIYVRNRVNFYVEEISALKKEYAGKSADQTLLPNLSKYAIELSVTIGTLLVAGVQFSTQDSSRAAAALALFLAAGSRLAPALLRIQQNSIQIQSNSSLAEPTIELIREHESIQILVEETTKPINSEVAFLPIVNLKNVTFSYSSSKSPVLDDINLTVSEGEMLALVGPSGSGKSTLIDLILGLLTPSSGQVSISYINPKKSISTWPGMIGYVPQNVNLLNASVSRNLSLGYKEGTFDQKTMRKSLELAKLSEIPLELKVGENGANLSGGQRQRLGIARALMFEPKLLILDEATSALDSETEHAISASLEQLRGKITLIVVAHRLSTVKSATKVAYLDNGKLLASGTFEEVRLKIPAFDKQAKLMGL
jgi:ABC-type multidrug transport system fused ATPase/permease subunit